MNIRWTRRGFFKALAASAVAAGAPLPIGFPSAPAAGEPDLIDLICKRMRENGKKFEHALLEQVFGVGSTPVVDFERQHPEIW